MVMTCVWTTVLLVSVVFTWLTQNGSNLSRAVMEGAQAGITLAIAMAGPICLWSAFSKLMEKTGITRILARFFRPVLQHLFPSAREDSVVAGHLSSNICANFLGLGNAATPMGIAAVKALKDPAHPTLATDEMCRLVVLNTASIQLLPTSVAAIRSSLGAAAPFDILPAVWVTSFCSAGLGLAMAWLLGKVIRHD